MDEVLKIATKEEFSKANFREDQNFILFNFSNKYAASNINIWCHVLLSVARNWIFYLLKSLGYKKYNAGKS